MLASEFIKELQQMIQEHGDLEVLSDDVDFEYPARINVEEVENPDYVELDEDEDEDANEQEESVTVFIVGR